SRRAWNLPREGVSAMDIRRMLKPGRRGCLAIGYQQLGRVNRAWRRLRRPTRAAVRSPSLRLVQMCSPGARGCTRSQVLRGASANWHVSLAQDTELTGD